MSIRNSSYIVQKKSVKKRRATFKKAILLTYSVEKGEERAELRIYAVKKLTSKKMFRGNLMAYLFQTVINFFNSDIEGGLGRGLGRGLEEG